MGFGPSILLESGMGSGFLGACLGFKKNLPKIRSEKTYPTNVSHPGFCWGKKCSQTHNSPDRNRIWSFGWIAWTAESYRKAWEQRLRDSSTKQEADCMMGRQKRLEFWSWLSCSYKMYMRYIYILYLLYLITKDSYSIKRQTKRQIYHPFDTMGYWKWKISSFAFIFLKTISLAPEKWMVGRLFFMGTFVIFFLEVSLSHTLSMYGIFLYI